MADVKAKECDRCKRVYPADQNTKHTTTYKGEVAGSGKLEEDLCKECADQDFKALHEKGVKLEPLPVPRQGGKKKESGPTPDKPSVPD